MVGRAVLGELHGRDKRAPPAGRDGVPSPSADAVAQQRDPPVWRAAILAALSWFFIFLFSARAGWMPSAENSPRLAQTGDSFRQLTINYCNDFGCHLVKTRKPL